jgi:endonuclease-8
MPEGNEIHRFAERHAAALAGRRVSADSPNGAFPDAELLHGRKLRAVEAYGKHLGYIFGRDTILHIHLGMYGDFKDGQMPLPPEKGALRLRLWNKFHWVELRGATDCSIFDAEKWQALLGRLGPDPLRPESDPEPGFAVIARRNTPIGQLLMDQSVFAGIGNIYRAELLFRAGLHPRTPGREVPRKAVAAIWKDACRLMPQGMEDRRIVTTLARDRAKARAGATDEPRAPKRAAQTSQPGAHSRRAVHDEAIHYVYRRHGKPCLRCGTKIEKEEMAGRTVYWCPACQRR